MAETPLPKLGRGDSEVEHFRAGSNLRAASSLGILTRERQRNGLVRGLEVVETRQDRFLCVEMPVAGTGHFKTTAVTRESWLFENVLPVEPHQRSPESRCPLGPAARTAIT